MVLDNDGRGERSYDLYSVHLKYRNIFLNGQVEDQMANLIVMQLLYLDAQDNTEISLYVNSPGGVVTAGMAIIDAMNTVKSPVSTIVMGQACSMGSMIMIHGEPGKRKIMQNARVMFHQPSGGARGMASDIEIQANEIKYLKAKLNKMVADKTGQPLDVIERVMDRDTFMSAEEALAFGAVDSII